MCDFQKTFFEASNTRIRKGFKIVKVTSSALLAPYMNFRFHAGAWLDSTAHREYDEYYNPGFNIFTSKKHAVKWLRIRRQIDPIDPERRYWMLVNVVFTNVRSETKGQGVCATKMLIHPTEALRVKKAAKKLRDKR